MASLYFSDEECREAGFSPPMIATLRHLADFVDAQERLAAAEAAATALDATVVALDGTVTAADAAIVVLDGRIDAYDALAPFVRQDQGAAWTAATGALSRAAYASYAAATISNPPTQAEMQTVANALQAASQALVALITDSKANGVLT